MLFQRILRSDRQELGRRGLAATSSWSFTAASSSTPIASRFETILGSPAIRLQEVYPCSEGFIAFGDPGDRLLRLVFDHGMFYEFVPVDELDSPRPTRHWLGDGPDGGELCDRRLDCAGLWAHVIGDTVRFESLDPPLINFTGRTRYTLSAFGEHLISEEVEAAMARAWSATGASVREWHVGPVFSGARGYHQYVVEFLNEPVDLGAVPRRAGRGALQAQRRLSGSPRPRCGHCRRPRSSSARAGSFESWMRRRGKLGGQNKVPRMDNSGVLTRDLVDFVSESRQARQRGFRVAAGG